MPTPMSMAGEWRADSGRGSMAAPPAWGVEEGLPPRGPPGMPGREEACDQRSGCRPPRLETRAQMNAVVRPREAKTWIRPRGAMNDSRVGAKPMSDNQPKPRAESDAELE